MDQQPAAHRFLARYFAVQIIDRLSLSAPLKERARAVVELLGSDHRVAVSEVHAALYPESSTASANRSMQRLAEQVNTAAATAGVPFVMRSTTDKRPGPAGRWVWFEGRAEVPDPATPDLDRIETGALVARPRGLPLSQRPVVVLFTYNEHETAAVMDTFSSSDTRDEIRDGKTYVVLGVVGGHQVVLRICGQGVVSSHIAAEDAVRVWQPSALISVGIAYGQDRVKQSIGDVLVASAVFPYELVRRSAGGREEPRGIAYRTSAVFTDRLIHLDHRQRADPSVTDWPTVHMGVVLSGSSLVDDADYKEELARLYPRSVGGEMEGIGVAAVGDARGVDWCLVKAICDWGDGTKGSATKDQDQRMAANHAAYVVHAMLNCDRLWAFSGTSTSPESPAGGAAIPASPRGAATLAQLAELGGSPYDVFGRSFSMEKASMTAPLSLWAMGQEEDDSPAPEDGVDVLAAVRDWIDGESATPVFAVLGEYGMGKTIVCQRLASDLDDTASENGVGRFGLYFDLKLLTGLDRRVPTLDEVLAECMSRGWKRTGSEESFTPDLVYKWLDDGAVIIFDGLDEALVKMSMRDGQTLTRTLLSIVDISRQRKGRLSAQPRVVISCRTQYFRTLRDQQNHFTGYERGNTGPEAFRAVVLLPLTEDQILAWLGHALPGQSPERTLATVRSVHNLEELTHRPYTLRLIGELLPSLEKLRLEGRPVYGVTLYRAMARTWLERDEGKHSIRADDKLLLAEDLARHLWGQNLSSVDATGLEDWFHEWRETTPALRRRYRDLPVDQLEEDLRTATFLARVDGADGSSGFRFAHTSLLEFFLSQYLLRALVDDRPDSWSLQPPSPETMVFVAQSIAERDDHHSLLARMSTWAREERPATNLVILDVTLAARSVGLPNADLRAIDLSGSDLTDKVVDGRSRSAPLDLSRARLNGVTARRSRFAGVRLDETRFENAQLTQAEFLDCGGDPEWADASLVGALWRSGDSTSGEVSGPRSTSGCPQVVEASEGDLCWSAGHNGRVSGVAFSADGTRLATAGDDGTARIWDTTTGRETLTLTGQTSSVSGVVFSADGTRLATAGGGGTRVWDTATGRETLTLTGHTGWAWGVAFSPDGTRLATAGGGGTARVWDPATGRETLTLTGHTGIVWGVTFSPDGTRLATAGGDGTARVWDTTTGRETLTLTGHTGRLSGVVFSPDGTRLATAGDDGHARIWDTTTGRETLTLTGHTSSVWGVAFSPDGTRLATAGGDGTARVWDTTTGRETLTLTGHTSSVSGVAFSPDGTRLATAGGGGNARVWDTATGRETLTLTGHTGMVSGVAFSPDGTQLATAGGGGHARVWDTTTGRETLTLTGRASSVWGVAFSPDGTQLATAGDNGTGRVWDTATGRESPTPIGHTSWVWGVAFSPDGTRLATAGGDGTARVWDTATGGDVLVVGHLRRDDLGVTGVASWDPRSGTILFASGAYWRALKFAGRDDRGVTRLAPIPKLPPTVPGDHESVMPAGNIVVSG